MRRCGEGISLGLPFEVEGILTKLTGAESLRRRDCRQPARPHTGSDGARRSGPHCKKRGDPNPATINVLPLCAVRHAVASGCLIREQRFVIEGLCRPSRAVRHCPLDHHRQCVKNRLNRGCARHQWRGEILDHYIALTAKAMVWQSPPRSAVRWSYPRCSRSCRRRAPPRRRSADNRRSPQ